MVAGLAGVGRQLVGALVEAAGVACASLALSYGGTSPTILWLNF